MRHGLFLVLTLQLLLAMAVNAYGLTTFGKSQNTPNQPPPPPAPRGRDCQFEADCQAIQNTSCVHDPQDGKLRCLCGDNKAPINGICQAKFKGLKHSCTMDSDCMEGSECVVNKHAANRGAPKICKCSEGFSESFYSCNDGVRSSGLPAGALLILTAVLARTLLY